MDKIASAMLSMIVIASTPNTIEYKANHGNELINDIVIELSVEDKIRIKADEYGLNQELMLRIADAESQFRSVPNYKYTDENGRYTAFGIFQITRTTWKTYCDEDNTLEQRSNIDKNIECAMIIASESGVHHWNESKNNW